MYTFVFIFIYIFYIQAAAAPRPARVGGALGWRGQGANDWAGRSADAATAAAAAVCCSMIINIYILFILYNC